MAAPRFLATGSVFLLGCTGVAVALFLSSPCGPSHAAGGLLNLISGKKLHCYVACIVSSASCQACCSRRSEAAPPDDDTSTSAYIAFRALRNASSCFAACTAFALPEVTRLLEDADADADRFRELTVAVSGVADEGDAAFWARAMRAGRPVSLAALCARHVLCLL